MRGVATIAALLLCVAGFAADSGEEKPAKENSGPGARMDYGDVISYFVHSPADKKEIVYKGISIKLGADAGICFDVETLRFVAGWSGGFVDMTRSTPAVTGQGSGMAQIKGKALFANKAGPGWANKGDFKDPRPGEIGNLPTEWGKYRGFYRHGAQVVLAYALGDCELRELPGVVESPGATVFTRAFQVGKTGSAQTLRVCEVEGAGGGVGPRTSLVPGSARSGAAETSFAVLDQVIDNKDAITAVGLAGAPKGATLELTSGHITLKLPPLATPAHFTVAIWCGTKTGLGVFDKLIKDLPAPDFEALCKGGAERWKEQVTTQGKLGAEDAPFVVDTLALPSANPWNSWMRPTGFDFLGDGRAAMCTFGGDVWLVSGIDDQLDKLTWKRFASGLFEPLGLKVVDGVIYVLGRDQITRLTDLNNDGEADCYENFFNTTTIYHDYHDFSFDLQTDKAGNFYYAKGGNRVPWNLPLHSCVFKIAKDGSKSEIYATGFRACNGMGMGPNDELTVSDNQGHWTPACKIDLIKKGGWYAYMADPRLPENKDFNNKRPEHYDPPLCWIPMAIDNSSGGEAWAGDKWGPLKGQMLHLSYGQSTLMEVMYEEVGGVPQGGVVKFPLKFDSGAMRARFNPKDGQLYVCGIKGWQTNAGLDGCFQRVRYTGKPVYLPNSLHVSAKGIHIGFTTALDKSAADAGNFSIEEWNYKWSSDYGSPDYSPADPNKKGRDKVEITAARLSADGKAVLLEIPGLKPVMQMAIKFKLKAADGTAINQEIYNTINVVPK